MDASVPRWFSDLGIELPSLMLPWEMSAQDEFATQEIWESFEQSISLESYSSNSSYNPPLSTSNTIRGSSVEASYMNNTRSSVEKKLSPHIPSFGSPDSSKNCSNIFNKWAGAHANTKEERKLLASCGSKKSIETMVGQDLKKVNALSRPISHKQDHVIAERKRREKLSKRFIALSAAIPGLKKIDKVSVLGDAIEYMEQLQGKVKTLEDKGAKLMVESAVLVKKSKIFTEDDGSSYNEIFDSDHFRESFPLIEVKLTEKTFLIRIHCEKHKGILPKLLIEIENLHLDIISTSAVSFTDSSLDVTITAQIDEEFSMTVKEVLKKLTLAFREFIL